ncbi:uncharacterized protein LOC118180185 [Stegodyphus dumicola]|uniref:uncharacterized protein LOC118180185 n=1 Tax=Stegodyphus dumicola TaxID=202533 RepID=UPI0015ADA002|nr:uncharacterized protein LOC118180185 [Stegodyphus dumicola]
MTPIIAALAKDLLKVRLKQQADYFRKTLSMDWIKMINIYLPNGQFSVKEWDKVLTSLPGKFIILGDFNCHNPAWGSSRLSAGGRVLLEWCNNNNLCILNTGKPTHVSPGGIESCIDIALCSAELYGQLKWEVSPDPFSSDHYPIKIKFANDNNASAAGNQRIIVRYDWKKFATESSNRFRALRPEERNLENFNRILSATKKENLKKIAIQRKNSFILGQKRKCLRLSKAHLSIGYWISCKKWNAYLKRVINIKRRFYWEKICSHSRKDGNLFRIVKNIQNNKSQIQFSNNILKYQNGHAWSPEEQSVVFAKYYSRFTIQKFIPLDFSDEESSCINSPFSGFQLDKAIRSLKNSAPGQDDLTRYAITVLADDCKHALLEAGNKTWNLGLIPKN